MKCEIKKSGRGLTRVPQELIENVSLTPQARFLYICMLYGCQNGTHYKSFKSIMGCGRYALRRYSMELEKEELIKLNQQRLENGRFGMVTFKLL